jgi:NADH-quinone oxidoreductase E subunit
MLNDMELQKVKELRSHYPTDLSAVMGVLHMLQDKYGYISGECIDYVAALLSVPAEYVLGVVTFYEMFHEHPLGRYNLQVCTNVSCMLRGSDAILEAIRKRLGIGPGETTNDGKFTVHEVECLGACSDAPVMSVWKNYHELMTPEKVNALIDELLASDN